MEALIPILVITTLGSLAGLAGGLVLLHRQRWAALLSTHGIPFAAGVLLAVSFLDILPEAIEKSGAEEALRIVLLVMVVAFFFEQFFLHIHHHKERSKASVRMSLPLVVAGDTIHNFIDGLSIAAAYIIDPSLGLFVAVAAFLHEIPQEIGDFGIMIAGGWSKRRTVLVNISSALAAYTGAVLVLLFSANFSQNLGILLAVAGGIFLYIGASDLIPQVQEKTKKDSWHQALLLLFGVTIVWLFNQFLPR